MANVIQLEDRKTAKLALKILAIAKSIYEEVSSLCEAIRVEESEFIAKEIGALIELAYEQLGIEHSEHVQDLLYNYLDDELLLDEFVALARQKKTDDAEESQHD
ncbi:hypothetical protein [Paenibacillus aceris]|uniref:Uncharacterized protein n=1 Tax=Paenibacillus aceris TaxID=869555 RepID=A0ABS4I797_9BACL|nr:hypothetical protein [Paenibacillus aceris]MBP1966797.1 hypothetical protein [Paenibacillus aceris]NHW39424.1 hypothetical protein [Paenibacillus aceris]